MANQFSAGDLNLTIQGIAADTINSLDAVLERLSAIQGSLGTISSFNRASYIRKSQSGNRTEKTYNITKYGKQYLTLSKDIQRAEDMSRRITTQFDKQGKVLKKTTVEVDKYGNKITKILDNNVVSPNGMFQFLKTGIGATIMRRMGRFMSEIVQAGSDYNETLNLWQVAMKENIDLADTFVTKMQKVYGISSTTLMKAQATFKNMIGSLGQITSETAYELSEALVQMSADFSSLYNVSLESAFEKMQSMLAGQVRPIRSAGLDMTETTLYMFYQQLGGTKTMRQLNRTEKQLLSILAVYKQMGSAGALGDMGKTINQFANQSRMMTEYWSELKTWSGLVLKDTLDQMGVLIGINAALITMTEIIKAVAKSRGLGEDNFIDGLFESTEATNDEIDELQGKLLDFDKFRSLEGATDTSLAIDQTLLDAISGYSTQMTDVENKAKNLADSWLAVLGFERDANGELTISESNLGDITNVLDAIAIGIGVILGYRLVPWLLKVITGFNGLKAAAILLNYALITGVVYAILQAIDAFERGDYAAGILATTIGVVLVGSFVLLNKNAIAPALISIGKFLSTIIVTNVVSRGFALGITGLSLAFISLSAAAIGAVLLFNNWADMNTAQRIAAVCGIVATAVLGVAIAMGAFHSAWSLGLAATGIVAGIAAIGTAFGTIQKQAETPIQFAAVGASDLDGGTLFVAGEMGKTEAVYTGANGKTNVANVKQMRLAFLGALEDWTNEYLDNELEELATVTAASGNLLTGAAVYASVKAEAKRRGEKFAKA